LKLSIGLIIGVHPDEVLFASTLKQFLEETFISVYSNISFFCIDICKIHKSSLNGCNRFRSINNKVHDLNRIYTNCLIAEEQVIKAVDILASYNLNNDNILSSFIQDCKNANIDLKSLFQGSQPFINGFFGFTDNEIRTRYEMEINECLQYIIENSKDAACLTLIDLHSGYGSLGQISIAYSNFIDFSQQIYGYYVEEIARRLVKSNFENINVMVLEIGSSTTYTHMNDVLLEIRSYLLNTEFKKIENINKNIINLQVIPLKLSAEIIKHLDQTVGPFKLT